MVGGNRRDRGFCSAGWDEGGGAREINKLIIQYPSRPLPIAANRGRCQVPLGLALWESAL